MNTFEPATAIAVAGSRLMPGVRATHGVAPRGDRGA